MHFSGASQNFLFGVRKTLWKIDFFLQEIYNKESLVEKLCLCLQCFSTGIFKRNSKAQGRSEECFLWVRSYFLWGKISCNYVLGFPVGLSIWSWSQFHSAKICFLANHTFIDYIVISFCHTCKTKLLLTWHCQIHRGLILFSVSPHRHIRIRLEINSSWLTRVSFTYAMR